MPAPPHRHFPFLCPLLLPASSSVLRLVPEEFQRYLKVVPGLKQTLDVHCKERLIETLRKFQIPFFLGMPEARWKHLAHLCHLEAHGPDERIVEEAKAGEGKCLLSARDLSR